MTAQGRADHWDMPTTSERIEAFAWQLLAKHHIDTPPVNVDEIAQLEGLNFEVQTMERGDGAYFRDPNGLGHAVIARSASLGRMRFSKGHELGHHLLDEPTRIEIAGMPYLALPLGYRGRDRHWAHERFAAALLMPRQWVGAHIRNRGWRLERGPLIRDVARLFDVSLRAAEIRLIELGHLEEVRR